MTYEEATKFLKNVITYPLKPNCDSKYPNYWRAKFNEVLALLEEQDNALRILTQERTFGGQGMTNSEIALLAIKRRVVYDLNLNSYVWVNKLIYWKDELMITGYSVKYKVSEYGKTWKLSAGEGLEQRYTTIKNFDKWLLKTRKLNKKYKNGNNTEENDDY